MLKTSRPLKAHSRLVIGVLVLASLFLAACEGAAGDSWAGVAKAPDDNFIYVSNGGRVVAVDYHHLDAEGQAQIAWEYDEGDAKFFAVPTAHGDMLYVGDYKGRMHAINRFTGAGGMIYKPEQEDLLGIFSGLLSHTPEDRIISSATINTDIPGQEMLYFGLGSGNLEALTRPVGGMTWEKAWTFETDHGVWATPLYVPAYEPPAEDEPAADTTGDAPADETVPAADETPAEPAEPSILPRAEAALYIVTLDKHLYALDPVTGKERWRLYLGGAAPAAPAYDPYRNWAYVGTFKSEVVAIDLNTGREVDRYKTEDWVWNTPQFVDGMLYFGDMKGYLYGLTVGDDGFEETWKLQVAEDSIRGAPLVLDGLLVVGSKDKHVYAVSRHDGTLAWEQQTDGKVLTELVSLTPAAGDTSDASDTGDEAATTQIVVVGTDKRDELLIAYNLYKVEGDDVTSVGWTYSDKTKLAAEQQDQG